MNDKLMSRSEGEHGCARVCVCNYGACRSVFVWIVVCVRIDFTIEARNYDADICFQALSNASKVIISISGTWKVVESDAGGPL